MSFSAFYAHFLDAAAHLLRPGGRLVFLAWKRGLVDKANRPARRFRRLHVRVVETGGIYPRIYVMERRGEAWVKAPEATDRTARADVRNMRTGSFRWMKTSPSGASRSRGGLLALRPAQRRRASLRVRTASEVVRR